MCWDGYDIPSVIDVWSYIICRLVLAVSSVHTLLILVSHSLCICVQLNLVNMNSTGPSNKVHIKRNFTLTVARYMDVILPGDFKVVHIKRNFALNVFVLTRFHCSIIHFVVTGLLGFVALFLIRRNSSALVGQ